MSRIFKTPFAKSLICIVLLLSLAACGRVQMEIEVVNGIYNLEGKPFNYADGFIWTTGTRHSATQDAGQTGQGINNFYYMYTTETNVTIPYDVLKIRDCYYSPESHAWLANINGNTVSVMGERETPDTSVNAQNFGTCMNIDTRHQYYSSVIGFWAPQDGVYQFEAVSISLGNTNPAAPDSDGVRLVVCDKVGTLYSSSFTDHFRQDYSFEINVSLKKGEFVYFIVDPMSNTKNDLVYGVNLQVSLSNSLAQMDIDGQTAWGFGNYYYLGARSDLPGNGWHYLYAPEKNEYGVYDTGTFKECDLGIADVGNKFGEVSEYYTWTNSDGAGITPVNGLVRAGETTAAVIALEVPETGYYAFDLYFSSSVAGNFSVYCGTRRVRVPQFEEDQPSRMSFQAEMQKGERFYFILTEGTSPDTMIAARKIAEITGVEKTE